MSLRKRLEFTTEPLYLMDGSAFIYRSFYAFQTMTRSDGFPTNALYIVARLILRLWREEHPHFFAFIFDGKGPSFRHGIYDAYKAQRLVTPEPLIVQIAPLQEFLKKMGIPVLVSDGYEADDYIASLAYKFRAERPVVIIGSDKDLKQCLHANVVLWDPGYKEDKLVTLPDFTSETGMDPESWPDYQALVGDSSDNIPGIPQVGPKTAMPLMVDFPKLEDLFARLPAVPPKVRKKLEGHEEIAFMCRKLTTLDVSCCKDIPLPQLEVRAPDIAELAAFMSTYEMRALAREVASMERAGVFGGYEQPFTMKNTAGAKASRMAVTNEPSGSIKTSDVSPAEENVPLNRENSAALSSSEERSARQLSLLDTPASGKKLVGDHVRSISLPAELPSFGKSVSIFAADAGILLASEDWEVLYTGSAGSLATMLAAHPCRLVCVDAKSLWHRHPELFALDTERWYDLALAAYILSPEERSYDWGHLVLRFGEQIDAYGELQGKSGLLALALAALMQGQLRGFDLYAVFHDLESQLIPVLYFMEKQGITIDKQAFASFLLEVQTDLARLTDAIYEQAGRVFNIRSSQQLADVLFSVLELPHAGKTKGGAMSTSQENLEKLRGKHPIISLLLEYRVLEKLRSTYLEPLPDLADFQNRIHTTFNQMATATGRLSSSNPNLQNIPIRGRFGGRMRGCFIAGSGQKLIGADYSQIELRVLAHLSQDPTLLDAFHKNEDIHSRTASLLFDVPAAAVSPEQRRSAKTINFGLIYGMGAQKLAQELQLTVSEAKAFIERYFSKLGKLKSFYESIEADARQHGYVVTMAGRRRFTPDISSANSQLRSQARRQAINARIQGSAADIIKLAMLAVARDAALQEKGARLLLQIHDELVLEVPEGLAEEAAQRVARLMEGVAPLNEPLTVPLLVDCHTGLSWAETHD